MDQILSLIKKHDAKTSALKDELNKRYLERQAIQSSVLSLLSGGKGPGSSMTNLFELASRKPLEVPGFNLSTDTGILVPEKPSPKSDTDVLTEWLVLNWNWNISIPIYEKVKTLAKGLLDDSTLTKLDTESKISVDLKGLKSKLEETMTTFEKVMENVQKQILQTHQIRNKTQEEKDTMRQIIQEWDNEQNKFMEVIHDLDIIGWIDAAGYFSLFGNTYVDKIKAIADGDNSNEGELKKKKTVIELLEILQALKTGDDARLAAFNAQVSGFMKTFWDVIK